MKKNVSTVKYPFTINCRVKHELEDIKLMTITRLNLEVEFSEIIDNNSLIAGVRNGILVHVHEDNPEVTDDLHAIQRQCRVYRRVQIEQ